MQKIMALKGQSFDAKLHEQQAQQGEQPTGIELDPKLPGLVFRLQVKPGVGEQIGLALAGDEQDASAFVDRMVPGRIAAQVPAVFRLGHQDGVKLAALEALAIKNDFQIIYAKVDESGEVGFVISEGEVVS